MIFIADSYHHCDKLEAPHYRKRMNTTMYLSTYTRYICLNVNREGPSDISRVLPLAAQAAYEAAESDGVMLVCCDDGTNHSITVAIVVVMTLQECSLAEAWEMVNLRMCMCLFVCVCVCVCAGFAHVLIRTYIRVIIIDDCQRIRMLLYRHDGAVAHDKSNSTHHLNFVTRGCRCAQSVRVRHHYVTAGMHSWRMRWKHVGVTRWWKQVGPLLQSPWTTHQSLRRHSPRLWRAPTQSNRSSATPTYSKGFPGGLILSVVFAGSILYIYCETEYVRVFCFVTYVLGNPWLLCRRIV